MSITVQGRPNLSHTLCFLFSGKAGTGKTYWADKLKVYLDTKGFKTTKTPFASEVKNTGKFMGWDGNKDQKGRRLLQKIGQCGREYDEYLWVRKTFNSILESNEYPYDAVIIDDWRFINEYKFIVENEPLYKPIRIRIDAKDREILVGTPEYHEISEIELDKFEFDYTIHNHKEIAIIDESCLYEKLINIGDLLPLNGAIGI